MSDPTQEFQPGQLVEYVGPEDRFAGTWEVVRYDKPDDKFHLWEVKQDVTPIVYRKVSIYNTSLRPIKAKEEASAGCTCSITDLMAKGCTCGQMARERT